jgi:hypothetical protein
LVSDIPAGDGKFANLFYSAVCLSFVLTAVTVLVSYYFSGFYITWFLTLYVVFKIRVYIQAGTFCPLTILVILEGASEKDGQLKKPSENAWPLLQLKCGLV